MYPVVFFDALRVKIREDAVVRSKAVYFACALKPIYTAPSAEVAQAELNAPAVSAFGHKFPTVITSWRQVWDKVIPFFAFPPEIRRVIHTTNSIESVFLRLRKIIKTRSHFQCLLLMAPAFYLWFKVQK